MTTQNDETTKNKPAHKIKDGALCITIWRNDYTNPETGEIKVIYSLDFKRNYKVDEEWKATSSINAADGLRVSNLYHRAHNWVLDQKQTPEQQ